MFVQVVVIAGILVCAAESIAARRLLYSALWLAGCSALVALEMYLLGAPELAVIELSVGAGLVTVLFVFAINIAGDEPVPVQSIVPRPLALGIVVVSVALLAWMDVDILGIQVPVLQPHYFKTVLWENRLLDLVLQLALIFAGVMSVLGLLAEPRHAGEAAGGSAEAIAAEIAAGAVTPGVEEAVLEQLPEGKA